MSEWDPNEFLKEQPVARLAQHCMDNSNVSFPDGTKITHEGAGFAIRNRHGHELAFHHGTSKDAARSVAADALDQSAMSRHKKSVGGHKQFWNLKRAQEGKSINDESTGIIL